jgi:hypothetical protein
VFGKPAMASAGVLREYHDEIGAQPVAAYLVKRPATVRELRPESAAA